MTHPVPTTVLVLDAMGVIYPVGDDVAELLCPFINERGGESDRSRIEPHYREASLGRISAAEFWQAVRLDPAVEDEYVDRFRLSPGLLDFLADLPPRVESVWCLSNDVSQWSRKLRARFGLDRFIRGFVISGDLGARKPDPAIYHNLIATLSVEPGRILFVDDRQPNLDTAKCLGINTIHFVPAGAGESAPHRMVNSFQQLRALISSMGQGT